MYNQNVEDNKIHKENSQNNSEVRETSKPSSVIKYSSDKKTNNNQRLLKDHNAQKSRNQGVAVNQCLTYNNPQKQSAGINPIATLSRNTVESAGVSAKPKPKKSAPQPKPILEPAKIMKLALNFSQPSNNDGPIKKSTKHSILIKNQVMISSKINKPCDTQTINQKSNQLNMALQIKQMIKPTRSAGSQLQAKNTSTPQIITEESRYPCNHANISLLQGKSKESASEMSSVFTFKNLNQNQPQENKKGVSNQFLISSQKRNLESNKLCFQVNKISQISSVKIPFNKK